ncbi:NEQ087 [Nanoarchaeum equitans Kin4-M]|uniref:Lysine--tRNA ligase n=1 Tax=Nanoarchaeum equitans (strain Kin4-M) TaxID=228908 RepID=Q74N85_NANEQ|nr:NEQ087 [Nanoarchaeum equitans Kin4-M]
MELYLPLAKDEKLKELGLERQNKVYYNGKLLTIEEYIREKLKDSDFWAVKIALEAIERAKKKNKDLITVRCANTPTGVLHIGNANDVIRAYFIAKVIDILGYNVRLVFTSDDRDPMRGFPSKIADKYGNIVDFKEKHEYEQKYDGFPVARIPDPFKCHSSWSEHFISIYFKEFELLGIIDNIRFEYYSPSILYNTGLWENLVKKALENKDKINEILREHKEHVREYPFSVICENCNRIGSTHVINYNPKTKEVEYICESRHLKKKTIQGCGYKGKTTIRNGKLDWYVEWAMDWAYFDTDVEPMGKDHYVSSWKISPKIAKEVFNIEPPIPVVYEFFTVDGKKMSGSKGNIYNLTEFLKIMEKEVVLYLYTKRPTTHRDIKMENIPSLVKEYDELEKKVLLHLSGENKIENEEIIVYYLTKGSIPKEIPKKIEYSTAAIIGQIVLPKEYLINTHLPIKFEEEVLERIKRAFDRINIPLKDYNLERLRKATYWAITYGPERVKIKPNYERITIPLDKNELQALEKIIEYLEKMKHYDMEEIQTSIHNIIKEHTDPKKFYPKLYKMLINKEQGPKIASLIIALGKEEIIKILSNYQKS